MDIFDRSQTQKIVISSVLWCVGLALGVLFILLMWHASRLGGLQAGGVEVVGIGTTHLLSIGKSPLPGGGSLVSFQVLSGLVSYFLGWGLVALAVVLARLLLTRNR